MTFGVFGQTDLMISAVYDGPLSGGTPKGIELYVINDIADLGTYAVGSANNGGGTDGEEFFLSGSAMAGEYIYIATEAPNFNAFFGFDPDFTDGSMSINGDDAVELFNNGSVVDVFGDINVDGTGEAWDHVDSWAARISNSQPGGSTFEVSEWTFGGVDALDGETTNAGAVNPVPVGVFTTSLDVDPEPEPMGFGNQLSLSLLGTYSTGVFDESAAEIAEHDPATQRVFVVNGNDNTVDVLDIADPTSPSLLFSIDVAAYGAAPNSVSLYDGVVAVAVEADVKQDPGSIVFFDTDGVFLNEVTVGALPDMLTFTPDGNKVLVANEGEPDDDYVVDPEGSISIIDVSGGIGSAALTTVGFGSLTMMDIEGVRIFGPGATIAQDLEPEYITVTDDSQTAYAVCQENNALVVIDLNTNSLVEVVALGTKDFSAPGNAFDASNEADDINFQNWPVKGFYQPDAIKVFNIGGNNYVFTANEGDARDYDGFSEEDRVKDLTLDPTAFPDAATLQLEENLGRLNITNTVGDTDDDGDFDELYCYGARSFSIWDASGNLVWDSGDDLEQITADYLAPFFNSTNDDNSSFKNRSDDKGPEPEAIEVAEIDGKTYAFIGLERVGGIMIYDVTDPMNPKFENYFNNRNFIEFDEDEEGDPAPTPEQLAAAGDLGPEDVKFISGADSPTGQMILMVANEVSGTVSFFGLETPDYTLQILHASDLEGGVDAIGRAPNFAALVDAFEDEYANNVTISSGDNYIPGPFFNAASDFDLRATLQDVNQDFFGEPGLDNLREARGRADITICNIIGFDAAALGNHEFDAGTDAIGDIIGTDIRGAGLSDVRWLGAQFPYLSANLDFTNDDLNDLYTSSILDNTAFRSLPSDLTAAGDAPKIAPATLIERNGELIGVVGATTQILESITSTDGVTVVGPTMNDMPALADILQPVIDDLIAAGSNKIILTSHLQQFALEQELAGLLNGVDVILAGGSDKILADQTDRLRSGDTAEDTYPVIETNADGDPVLLVSTAGEYSYVGRLVVGFDEMGKVLASSLNEGVNGIYATDDAMIEQVYDDPSMAFVENSKGELVSRLTDAVNAIVIAKDGNILGSTDVFLDGRRSQVRTQETNLGNLTADANLAAARQFDSEVAVSLKNGGGIRAEIGEVVEVSPGVFEFLPPQANALSGKEAGEISQLDVENSLRFNNGLSVIELSASDLLEVMEHAFGDTEPGNTPGRFPQVAGMKVSFDPSLPVDARVRSLVIVDNDGFPVDSVVVDGEVTGDPERVIKIVTLDFLAGGGDGYPYPELGENRIDLEDVLVGDGIFDFAAAGSEQDAIAEYLNLNFGDLGSGPYQEAETPASEDERIQIIGERNDEVFVFCLPAFPDFFPVPEIIGVLQNSSSDFVLVRWEPVPGSTVCELRGGLVDGMQRSILVYADEDGTPPRKRRIPKSQLELGELHQFQIRCACSEDPLIQGPFSELEFVIPLGPVGTEIIANNSADMGSMSMTVFPNPSDLGFVNVTLVNNKGEATEGIIEVMDITGRRIVERRIGIASQQTVQIDLNGIPAGIYTVSYLSGQERVTSRVILK